MRYVIDRIEENFAVIELEAGKTTTIPLRLVADAKEGDTVVITIEKKEEDTKVDTKSIFDKLRNKL